MTRRYLGPCTWGLVALTLLGGGTAYAQLGQNGTPIATSRYAVDIYQGAVLASTRVIGMGGAYVAIAEGVEGSFYNPAAPAVRLAWSRSHVDYDLGAGMTFPGTLRSSDFFNSGSDRTNLSTSSPKEFVFLDGEGHLQVGPWGFGVGGALQQYGLKRDTVPSSNAEIDRLRARIYVVLVQAARATANGQLVVGVGLKPTGLTVVDLNPAAGQPSALFSTEGFGYSAGFLWRPTDAIFRVGASFTTAVKTRASAASSIAPDSDGNRVISPGTTDEIYLPQRVGLPWEFNIGFAAQFGARPFNPHWVGPNELLRPTRRRLEWRKLERQRHRRKVLSEVSRQSGEFERLQAALTEQEARAQADDDAELDRAIRQVDAELKERFERLGRWYLLLSTSLRFAGPVDNAVGVESFLQRSVDHSGRRTVVSPHVGLESEVIANYTKLRAGAYGEPTRFDNARAAPRLHTTLGLEQKLFTWKVFGLYDDGTAWRIHGAVDIAERYFGLSGSIGVWH